MVPKKETANVFCAVATKPSIYFIVASQTAQGPAAVTDIIVSGTMKRLTGSYPYEGTRV